MTQERKDLFKQYQEHLLSTRRATAEQLDKSILTLSSAGLGLSFALLKDIVPPERLVLSGVLFASWILFAAAILSTLVSFMLSQRAVDRQLENAEQYYLHEKNEYLNKPNPFADATKVCNIVSATAFVLAVVATIVFAVSNVSKGISMSDDSQKDSSQPVRIQEGYVPPRMQADSTGEGQRGYVPSQMPKVPAPAPSQPSGGTGQPAPPPATPTPGAPPAKSE